MTSPTVEAGVSRPVEAGNSWLSWSYWMGSASNTSLQTDGAEVLIDVESAVPSTSKQQIEEPEILVEALEETGWDRIKQLYAQPSMEVDVVQRVGRMTFLGGFLLGGSTGYLQARHAYETNNVGRKYLSPSDAFKRRTDYAIVRFAKGGFGMGFKCAFISGSIVLLSTHLAAYRNRFSSWYFPALSGAVAVGLHQATVGGVFVFPLGIIGSAKAVGLGITSGLTLSAVVHLYALSIDKSVDEAYRLFKRTYEKEMLAASEWDSRVKEVMQQEGFIWRQKAVKMIQKQDEERINAMDD